MSNNSQHPREHEVLSKDDEAVRRLVSGLPHIEAPLNFERRVMEKIAKGSAPARRPLLSMPSLAYGVPLVLILLIGAFFVFRVRQPAQPTETLATVNNVTPVETNSPPAEQPSVVQTQPDQPVVARSEEEAPTVTSNRQKRAPKTPAVNSARGGGSITFGLDETKRPLPQGLEPRAVSIRDIFQTLGMSAEFRNEWHVTSVSSNSAAERSGVKVGDVIVAVDDRELNAGSAFHGSGSFSTVKVRRGGKLIPIKIK